MSEEDIKKKSLLSVGFGEEIPNFFFVFFLKGFCFFGSLVYLNCEYY